MKQINILNAYRATEDLAKVNFSKEDQWKIYCLRKELRPHIEFQNEQEEKITEKFTPYADKNGNLVGQKYIEYLNEKDELYKMNVDINLEKVSLPFIDGINFKTVELLEDFIDFQM